MTAPRWAYETAALAMLVRDLHAQRATHYPTHIAKGSLTAADAETGIRLAAAIEADWQHVLTLQPRAGAVASKAEKIATLEAAAQRSQLLAGKARKGLSKVSARYVGDTVEMHYLADLGWFGSNRPHATAFAHAAQYAELVETLLWWERRQFDHLFVASLNIAAGRRQALAHREAA